MDAEFETTMPKADLLRGLDGKLMALKLERARLDGAYQRPSGEIQPRRSDACDDVAGSRVARRQDGEEMSTNRATAARTPAEMLTEAIGQMVDERVEEAVKRIDRVLAYPATGDASRPLNFDLLAALLRRELGGILLPKSTIDREAVDGIVSALGRAWAAALR